MGAALREGPVAGLAQIAPAAGSAGAVVAVAGDVARTNATMVGALGVWAGELGEDARHPGRLRLVSQPVGSPPTPRPVSGFSWFTNTGCGKHPTLAYMVRPG